MTEPHAIWYSSGSSEQALKSLNRRLDETKLFYHNSPEDICNTSRLFFQVRLVGIQDELVPIDWLA